MRTDRSIHFETGLQAVGVPLTTMVVWAAAGRNGGEGRFGPPSLWIQGNVRNRAIDGLKHCTTATRSGFGLGSTGLQAVGVPLTTMVVWAAVARNAGEGRFHPPSLWIRGAMCAIGTSTG
ncbi:MAG TPA: hypothetical protein VFB34_12770 [Chloroflexota bacterium]|nr:hypothetical protein [Chloroflexota bacterium]